MRFKYKFAAIVFACVLLGYGAHDFYKSSPYYRSYRVAELFELLCIIPFETQEPAAPEAHGLHQITAAKGKGLNWVDVRSGTIIKTSDKLRCSISANPPNGFKEKEFKNLIPKVERIVAHHFPELDEDLGIIGTAPFAKGWMQGDVASRERWGIGLWGPVAGPQEYSLNLTFYQPREQ